jgi:PPK2 family polyphosphate:nucleotide phosphotransferase
MKRYLVKPGDKIDLADWNPRDTSGFSGHKAEAEAELVQLRKRLDELQEMLYAEHRHKVLIILQAMDTGGKDGVVRGVFDGVNPQGVKVASFKVPSAVELDHDYLWRAHAQVPGAGEMVVFNRSHYEDVLVVRVHKLIAPQVWRRRYSQIKDFERMLAEEGTTILKFFLHISLDEQKERLLERLQDPAKHWKFNPGDLKERLLWDDYMQAYEDVLSKTSADHAPWYIVPADRKWYRNLVIARVLVDKLESLKMEYPKANFDVDQAMETLKRE